MNMTQLFSCLSFQVDSEGTAALPEITAEMLEQEYMKYLQWVYVDVDSELAFAAQVKELQV